MLRVVIIKLACYRLINLAKLYNIIIILQLGLLHCPMGQVHNHETVWNHHNPNLEQSLSTCSVWAITSYKCA